MYLEAGEASELVEHVRSAVARLGHPVPLHAIDPQTHNTAYGSDRITPRVRKRREIDLERTGRRGMERC